MFSIPCRCGKTKKNFKVEIGEFFINKCCLEAGFDRLGNKVEKSEDVEDSEEAREELSQAVVMSNEEAQKAKGEPDFEHMTAKALREVCKLKGIQFSKRDTRAKLIEKLTK